MTGNAIIDGIKKRAAERRTRTVRLTNPEDAAQVFFVRVPADGVEVDRLRTAAEKADKGRAVNVHFSRALLAQFTERIEEGGVPLEIDGDVVTFRDPALWGALEVSSAKDAVVEVIGSDGIITALAAKLLEEAGYGSAEVEDPTPA